MLSRHTLFALGGGLASGMLFCIAAYGSAGGLLLIYMPAFPLLCVGFTLGANRTLNASLAAILVVALVSDISNAAFFAVFTALPAFYFVHKALLWRESEGARRWYPVLSVLAELTTAAVIFFLVFSITANMSSHNGLQTIITRELASNLGSSADNLDFQIAMKWLTGPGSFLLFASTGWSWVLMLYAFAVFAHSLLAPHGFALRPSLAIEPRGLPLWLLGLLCINGVMAVMAHGMDRFIAETLFLLLLLPYFLAGTALVHQFLLRWRHRRLWLTLFYILLIFQVWLIALVAITGLCSQLTEILDKRRGIG